MALKRGTKGGKKVTKSHSSVTKEGEELVGFLTDHRAVTKVMLGVIESFKSSSKRALPPRVKVQDDESIVILKVTHMGASQQIRFASANRGKVKKDLTRFILQKGWILDGHISLEEAVTLFVEQYPNVLGVSSRGTKIQVLVSSREEIRVLPGFYHDFEIEFKLPNPTKRQA